jgi:hypothetical protein
MVNVEETEKLIEVNLPAITNKWVKRGEDPASQSIMMLSGVSAEAGDGVKVLIDPSSQQHNNLL